MSDSMIAIKHLINNWWSFISSVQILDFPFTLADMLVGVWIVSILSFLVSSLALPAGGINFGIISDYGSRNKDAISNRLEKQRIEAEMLHSYNIARAEAFERARANTAGNKQAAINRLSQDFRDTANMHSNNVRRSEAFNNARANTAKNKQSAINRLNPKSKSAAMHNLFKNNPKHK